jgi:hypothetical protein
MGVVLAAFLFGGYVGRQKGINSRKPLIDALTSQISHYTAVIHGDSLEIAQTRQELVTERQARRELEITNRDLRALNVKQANEISRLNLQIDTLLKDVMHNGEVISILDSQIQGLKEAGESIKKQKAILLPFQFSKKDKYLDLGGNFDINGRLDISLKMTAEVDVITGIDKEKKPTIVITSDNPYLKTIGVRSFKTDTPKPKRYGLGVQIGYGIPASNPLSLKPYVGVGISYNLIVF